MAKPPTLTVTKSQQEKDLMHQALLEKERKAAEEYRARLVAIVESSEDAIISKTLDSIVTSWNASAERVFGYTADEMIGQPIMKLIPPELLDEEPQIIERLKRGERVDHFETQRITKDGTRIEVSLTISPIKDSQGNIIGASKIARDITEIKRAEQRKDDFIKMASHELKTPITSIKGYVQLLQNIYDEENEEGLASVKPTTIRASLNTISKQVSRLTRLVSELLDLTRIESGKLEMHMSTFDIVQMVEESVEDARHLTSRHAILVDTEYYGTVYGDRDRISQVLLNLLTNAIKYSPDCSQIDVQVRGDKEFISISVIDCGIGIDKREHKKIFERFYRVEGKSEQTYPGFGIGLFIANEIVQRHDGTMSVESEKGKGSVFTFTLPINKKPNYR